MQSKGSLLVHCFSALIISSRSPVPKSAKQNSFNRIQSAPLTPTIAITTKTMQQSPPAWILSKHIIIRSCFDTYTYLLRLIYSLFGNTYVTICLPCVIAHWYRSQAVINYVNSISKLLLQSIAPPKVPGMKAVRIGIRSEAWVARILAEEATVQGTIKKSNNYLFVLSFCARRASR